ncbi:MAG TPA: aminotransferase class I/II-fold pyridoxal phosphate-dependent enzyme [Chitinophagaceae bacterium]|nr:aminotransferase class I/II-fold pyridoxal phosphate-dependent enzyme [Chitinophagaceae bacterium]
MNRKSFLRRSGLVLTPALLPAVPAFANQKAPQAYNADEPVVKFFADGDFFDGVAYLQQLEEANKKQMLKVDRYGNGGAVAELEKRFAEITGKEKAIYMPSGTMANQFAIAVLSGENTKVFLQDTSHVYRDEADAAQSIFNKRLMPLAKDKTFFTAEELKQGIENLDHEEVFKSGIGCVSIENPVRRSDGRMMPLDEIKKVNEYCRSKNIKMHLDGARIYMATAWGGTTVKEYASYFDTVYISLYKYLGASGGAILCGDKDVIEKMPHLIKIHGGNMFGNWLNAAMALHRLDGLEERLQDAIKRSKEIFAALEPLGITISALNNGTNIYKAKFPDETNGQKLQKELRDRFILMPPPGPDHIGQLTVNETILYREKKYIVDAFAEAVKKAK